MKINIKNIKWSVNVKSCLYGIVFLLLGTTSINAQFVHPGILHTEESFAYMKEQVDNQTQPAYGSFLLLESNRLASSSYSMNGPFSEIGRSNCPNGNSSRDDFIAAYYNALMWEITGNTAHAEKAKEILVGYANTLEVICGETDQILLVGMRGFIFVNAAEIMRDYMSASDLDKVKTMFEDLFVPICHDFYSWDPFTNGNIGASVCKGTIGYAVFLDDQELYDYATDWYLNGYDNGVLKYYVDDIDGQLQEAGRDQQHCHGGIGCLAEAAEVAYNQGDDLYSGYNNDNRLRKGFEYVAKYNLGNDVPFYTWDDVTGKYDNWDVISEDRRGEFRAIYEMAYNHYVSRMGMEMPWTEDVLDVIRPEGAGAWADHPGFGSLLFSYSGGSLPCGNFNAFGKIEAEAFCETEGANIVGDGLAIGSLFDGDWVKYDNVNFTATAKGIEIVLGKNHTEATTVDIVIDNLNGQSIATIEVPYTGGWYNWQTVFSQISDVTGKHDVYLLFNNSGSSSGVTNVESFKFIENVSCFLEQDAFTIIEAEDFCEMSGIQTEASEENGENIGYINNGDYIKYSKIDFGTQTANSIAVRVSSNFNGGNIEIRTDSETGTLIGSVDVINTGGNQVWETRSSNISSLSGIHDIYLVFRGEGDGYLYNINWLKFSEEETIVTSVNSEIEKALEIYPNPTSGIVHFSVESDYQITDAIGNVISSGFGSVVNISNQSKGIYFIKVSNENGSVIQKIIKQ